MNPRSEWRVRKLRALVAARDGFICYRCKQPIDPALRYPHKMSVSLEHVLAPGVTLKDWVAQGHSPYDPAICTVSHLTHNQSAGSTMGNNRRQQKQRRTELTW